MVYIWVATKNVTIIKQMDGDSFTIDSVEQYINPDDFIKYNLCIKSDTGEKYSFSFEAQDNNNPDNVLKFFGVCSPQKYFSTGINGYKNDSPMNDLKLWIQKEMEPIREIFNKMFLEESKLNKIKKDFD